MARSRIRVRMTAEMLASVMAGRTRPTIPGYTIPEDAWVDHVEHLAISNVFQVYLTWFDHGMAQAPVAEGREAPETIMEPAL